MNWRSIMEVITVVALAAVTAITILTIALLVWRELGVMRCT